MRKVKLTILSLLLLVGTTRAAQVIELTKDNWEQQLKGKTVLVYISLGCDIGSYASQMFFQAMEDLEGVYVSTFDYNSSYEMLQPKPYDLGTIALIKNGTVLETSDETYKEYHYLSGYNNQQNWVYAALKKHGISFTMPEPESIRLIPVQDNGSVDLNRGLNAIYRFDGTPKDETGHCEDFIFFGTSQIKDNCYYSDGKYDNNYTGGQYKAGKYNSNPFSNGFTVHVNVKLRKTDEIRKFVLSFGYRALDFEINKDKLNFSTSLYESKSGEESSYTDDFYPLTEVPFEYDQWNNIIYTSDVESGRLCLMINGVRYDDIHLTKRFISFFRRVGLNGILGVRFHNHGWGGLLDGYADDIVVYNRKVNTSEMKALYNKYKKNGTRIDPVQPVNNNTNNTNNNSSGTKWVQYNGSIPSNAVIGGYSANGDKMYIGLVSYLGGKHPGKVLDGKCCFGYGDYEKCVKDFEILTSDKKLQWVNWTGSAPSNIVTGGYENGSTLPVCRVDYMGGIHPGKVVTGKCNIAYDGNEIVISNNFSVLVEPESNNNNNNNNEVIIVENNAKEGTEVGDKAIDIVENSANGGTYKLSDLRGKLVLLDFWASWCGPCRRENPNVVSTYNKYKNSSFKNAQGFTVFSVSLDNSKSNWLNAIQADNLSWPYHVSDLAGWGSAAASKYDVRGIPSNVLIDGNGIILAKDLRGNELGETLEKYLK